MLFHRERADGRGLVLEMTSLYIMPVRETVLRCQSREESYESYEGPIEGEDLSIISTVRVLTEGARAP